MQRWGHDRALTHVCPHRQNDKAISALAGSACLGSDRGASAQDIALALASYIGEIDGLFSSTIRHLLARPAETSLCAFGKISK